MIGFRVTGGALAFALIACGGGGEATGPAQSPSTLAYEGCQAQEKNGDAASCWKYFLESYGATAVPAEKQMAQTKIEAAAAEAAARDCASGTSWDGKTCVALCSGGETETWEASEKACIRKIYLECLPFFHQEDGHCVPDATCPSGMKKIAGGGCTRVSPEEAAGLKPGMRIVALLDQHDKTGKVRVKRGDKGTYWLAAGDSAFVIWDKYVGTPPTYYPAASTGVPQGKPQFSAWLDMSDITQDRGSLSDSNLVPQWCGQRDPLSFGRIKVGSIVKLGKHRPVEGNMFWDAQMDKFVGAITRVKALGRTDSVGCPNVRVDIDKGAFSWRIRDLSIVSVSHEGPASAGPTTVGPTTITPPAGGKVVP